MSGYLAIAVSLGDPDGSSSIFCLAFQTSLSTLVPIQMPRHARIVASGYPVHLILRGIDRAEVFFENDDHRFFPEAVRGARPPRSGALPCTPMC